MSKINQIVYKLEDYTSEEDMYNKLCMQLKPLLQTNHAVTIYNNKQDNLIVLKFNYIDPSKPIEEQDAQFPYWLFPEEADAVFELSRLAQVEAFKQLLDEAAGEDVDVEFDDDSSLVISPKKPKYDA